MLSGEMHERPSFRPWAGAACKNGARWLLLAALVYAPLAFGSTRPEFKSPLVFALLTVFALFLAGNFFLRRLHRLPWPALALPLGLLAYGWFMVGNARQEFDPNIFRFFDRGPLFPGLPGAVDRATALPSMFMLTGILGAFWVAGDACRNPRWQNRFWLTICLAGLAVILLGLGARLTGLDRTELKTAFGTYPYHGNAGAFINLVLPFIAYRALAALRETANAGARSFWCLAALITAAAGFVNVSKAGAAITALLLAAMGLEQFLSATAHRNRRRLPGALLIGGFALVLLAVLGWAFGLDRAWVRWTELAVQITPDNTRLLVSEAIWRNAVPVSSWWGFGPGTFQITFPFFCADLGPEIKGIWRYAHQDYLQTLMEWGWAGASLWALLIFGGLTRGGLVAWKSSHSAKNFQQNLLGKAAFFSVLGVSLHALVDFPLQIASLQLYAAIGAGFLWGIHGEKE